VASVVALVAALIGCIGSIAAALITTRQKGPAGMTPVGQPITLPSGNTYQEVAFTESPGRMSKAFWFGLASLITWTIPIFGVCTIIPGLYIGIREMNGPRRRTGAGVTMCVIALVLTVINSAIGAYQGAHGQMWFQQG
jgi:hypothetical protein